MPKHPKFDEQEVLRRARDLFWRKGYAATSIQDLEQATGIKRSSLYNSFGGKRALYERTLREYQRESRRSLPAPGPRAPARLKAMLRRAIVRGDDTPLGCYLVNATTELAETDAQMERFVADNRESLVARFREFLAGAQGQGELSPTADPEALANFLFAGYNGLQVAVQTGMGRPELCAVADRLIDSLDWTMTEED